MDRGQGSYVFDTNGKRYLDLTSGQFCTVLGHCNAEVQAQIREKTARLVHTSTSVVSGEVVDCARQLHQISQDMEASSIILSTGAEVVEFCLRYAKSMQGKAGVLCFDKGYHGLTLGAQSVTFAGRYARPVVAEVLSVPAPTAQWTAEEISASLEAIDQVMEADNDLAAFLVEPIVSVGGMIFPPASWFQAVRELCDKHKVLLVLDECQTGFGRTGDWFAYQTYGFVPDMVATAKGIGLGYPVAVALFRGALIKRSSSLLTHYSSHQNDPFGAAVVNTGIDYIRRHDVLVEVREKGPRVLGALERLTQVNPHLVSARGLGLMLGVDLFYEGVTDYRPIYHQVSDMMLERGVLLQGTDGGHTLRFLPDYLIDVAAVEDSFFVLDEVCRALSSV
jgi:4-aminobutyrate aminotransferase-like enzyme